jgi:hypothetical protein
MTTTLYDYTHSLAKLRPTLHQPFLLDTSIAIVSSDSQQLYISNIITYINSSTSCTPFTQWIISMTISGCKDVPTIRMSGLPAGSLEKKHFSTYRKWFMYWRWELFSTQVTHAKINIVYQTKTNEHTLKLNLTLKIYIYIYYIKGNWYSHQYNFLHCSPFLILDNYS